MKKQEKGLGNKKLSDLAYILKKDVICSLFYDLKEEKDKLVKIETILNEIDKNGNFILDGKKYKIDSIIYKGPSIDTLEENYHMSIEEYIRLEKPKEISVKQFIEYEVKKIK